MGREEHMRTERTVPPKGRVRFVLTAALGAAVLSGHDDLRAQTSEPAAAPRLVHVLQTRGVGVSRPDSLAYGPLGAFVMVASRGAGFTDIALVTHELSVVGRVRLDAS